MKSRFILIDRESLLEEHKIPFKVYDQIKEDIKIDEIVLENAQPHVTFNESFEDKAHVVHNRSFSSHLLEESLIETTNQVKTYYMDQYIKKWLIIGPTINQKYKQTIIS